jgi:hypothetical protein
MNRPDDQQDSQRRDLPGDQRDDRRAGPHDESRDHSGGEQDDSRGDETYNPWSVVNLVFHHLADQGLHPILGGTGDPGAPAAQLLLALGITPALEGNRQVSRDVKEHLAEIRTAVFGDG